MASWAKPEYRRSEVDRAAKLLASDHFLWGYDRAEALAIVNNWRSAHSFPLNTFRVWLHRHSRAITPDALVAQRIKRLSSIIAKLSRYPKMKFTRMQDVGGCRSVVENVQQVHELVRAYDTSRLRHSRVRVDDYIKSPPQSGYRGVHLVYRYNSDKDDTYDGLRVEIQIRSRLQHLWATAVETVGTFVRQALKASQGEEKWLKFFTLASAVIAEHEGTPKVPGTPSGTTALRDQLIELDMFDQLSRYDLALSASVHDNFPKNSQYYLLRYEFASRKIFVMGYKQKHLDYAMQHYQEAERDSGVDAVLVSAESLDALRKAYPNYYKDTTEFIVNLQWLLSPRVLD
ncbi:MAG: RelA/SpoT domain-containing protein [Truepera sp.]|nr:RelA/SpoT domain-containing protein [Truepera sp.]